MLEVKVNVAITAPELAGAIGNLAAAISSKTQSVHPDNSKSAPVVQTPTLEQPTQAEPVASTATPVAGVPLAEAPQYTIDQIMTAGATLMDAGKVEDLVKLLHSFSVQAVTELKPEQLGAFATEMRKLGAAI